MANHANLGNWKTNINKIILLDNGAYEIKHSRANYSTQNKKFQNCKFFEKTGGNQTDAAYFINDIHTDITLDSLSNIGKNFSRPLSRGLLYDCDLQCEIWEKILKENYKITEDSAKENMLVFTHTPLAPDDVLEGFFQIIFEYFDFDASIKSIPHVFSAISAKKLYPDKIHETVQLVIDSGFSSTTIVPIFDNFPIYNSIKRVDIGGKLLTNYLKESLSNAIELDLRKDFFLVNLMKEENCFMSKNFMIDMKISALKNENSINKKTFLLPEYRSKTEEFLSKIPKEKYSIELNSLRFIVPELIVNPNICGIDEGGLAQGILESVKNSHPDFKDLLLENIILSGGNTKFENFKERLYSEIALLLGIDNKINLYEFTNHYLDSNVKKDHLNDFNVLEGMKEFCQNLENLKDLAIYKKDYEELGFNVVWKNCL